MFTTPSRLFQAARPVWNAACTSSGPSKGKGLPAIRYHVFKNPLPYPTGLKVQTELLDYRLARKAQGGGKNDIILMLGKCLPLHIHLLLVLPACPPAHLLGQGWRWSRSRSGRTRIDSGANPQNTHRRILREEEIIPPTLILSIPRRKKCRMWEPGSTLRKEEDR